MTSVIAADDERTGVLPGVLGRAFEHDPLIRCKLRGNVGVAEIGACLVGVLEAHVRMETPLGDRRRGGGRVAAAQAGGGLLRAGGPHSAGRDPA